MKDRWNRLFTGGRLTKEEGRRVLLLSAVGLLSAILTLTSFFTWQKGVGEGEIAQAASRMEEFFSEHEAIAVFFGWDEIESGDAP